MYFPPFDIQDQSLGAYAPFCPRSGSCELGRCPWSLTVPHQGAQSMNQGSWSGSDLTGLLRVLAVGQKLGSVVSEEKAI